MTTESEETRYTRAARAGDAAQLSSVHLAALPDDLLPKLGRGFLERFFYPMVLECAATRVCVGVVNSEIRSLCVIASPSRAVTRGLLRHPVALTWRLGRAIARESTLLKEMCSHLTGRDQSLQGGLDQRSVGEFNEIFVLAVDPSAQRRGLGGQTLNYALAHLPNLGAPCLTRTASADAARFYRRNGFVPVGEEHRGSRRLEIMLRASLPGEAQPDTGVDAGAPICDKPRLLKGAPLGQGS